MKDVTDQKLIYYCKQIIESRGIVATVDCLGHSKACKHSYMTNFKLFDMFRR